MTIEEARQTLGIAVGSDAASRKTAFVTQRIKLEQKLAQAPTPGLQSKYREAIRRLEEAYETLELLNEESDLPALRPDFAGAIKTSIPYKVEPSKEVNAAGYDGLKSSNRAERFQSKKVKWLVVAVVVLVLAMGWLLNVNHKTDILPQEKAQVQEAQSISTVPTAQVQQTRAASPSNELIITGLTNIQNEMLQSILNDADDAAAKNDLAAQSQFFREFLTKSEEVGDISTLTNLWILRAKAALFINDDQKAWEAGQKLLGFHLDNSDDPRIQKIIVDLERKDLLGATSPEAKAQEASREQEAAQYIGTWRVSRAGLEDLGAIYGKNYNVSPARLGKAGGSLVISSDSNLNLMISGQYSFTINDSQQGDSSYTGNINNSEANILPDKYHWHNLLLIQRHLTGSFECSGNTLGSQANICFVEGSLHLDVLSDSGKSEYTVPFEKE